ncbi:MAG: hypothetical protein ABW318_00035 [Vicinamibacterales bacterium]|jgi:hypothetical protein
MEAVRILTDGTVKNGHRNVKVKKNLGEAILFIAKGNGGPWTVKFEDGSPFRAASFDVPKGSYKGSGPLRDDVAVGESYKYSVFNAAGTRTDDPDVDIE